MWNLRETADPPCSTIKLPRAEAKDIAVTVKNACKVIAEIFENQACLEKEMFITERFVYKRCNQFRHHKLYRCFKKIHQCIKRWNSLTLGKYTNTVSGSINSISATHTYVPSRQVLQCLLAKLVGAAYLCHRFVTMIIETNVELLGFFELGHLVTQLLFVFANSSRLWVIMRGYLIEFIRLYSELKPLENSTPEVQQSEYAAAVNLPDDLTHLLPNQDMKFPQSVTQAGKKKLSNDSPEESSHPVVSDGKKYDFFQDVEMEDMGIPILRKKSSSTVNLSDIPGETTASNNHKGQKTKRKIKSHQSSPDSVKHSASQNQSPAVQHDQPKAKKTKKMSFESQIPVTATDNRLSGRVAVEVTAAKKIKPFLKCLKHTQNLKEINLILKDKSFVEVYPKAAKLQGKVKVVRGKVKKNVKEGTARELFEETKTMVTKAIKQFLKKRKK